MATKLDPSVSPQSLIEDYRHGFHDAENYVFKSDKGLTREIVERISAMKDEPAWMREFRLRAYELFLSQADAHVGRHGTAERDRFRRHSLLREIDRQNRALVGRRARGHQTDVRPSRHSRSRTQVSLRRIRAVRVRSRLSQHQRGTRRAGACCFATWIRPSKSTPTSSASISQRSFHPATTNSPRSTRPCGRAARSSTCRRASKSRCRCKRISESTPRTWGSSSGR